MENIFDFTDNVIQDYKKYSQSFCKIRNNDIKNTLLNSSAAREHEGTFCPEPLIQINPHYEISTTVPDLISDGSLHQRCKDIFKFKDKPMSLYAHQAQAISYARDKKDFIVTTGTGSGKSLAFFIPIVDRVLREKEKDSIPRTRAIVIYPMNALANSQMQELNKFLDNLQGAFSFGIYTGQEGDAERSRIAKNPPDILLTNFMMMELLLTRHNENDSRVIENCRGLEFLVLDELHTYRGRQGADVAMLIRRLRERTQAKDLICIGTSATMSNVGSENDQEIAVKETGRLLFGTQELPAVVTERLQLVTDSKLDIEHIRPQLAARAMEFAAGKASLTSFEDFKEDPLAVWLERTLGVEYSGNNLPKRATPISLSIAAEKLQKDAVNGGLSHENAQKAILNFLLDTYNLAAPDGSKSPFAFKLHQFIGAPGKLYLSLEQAGKRAVSTNGQKYVSGKTNDGIRLYSAYFCRECGQEFMPVWHDTKLDTYLPREIDDTGAIDSADQKMSQEWGFLSPAEPDAEPQSLEIPEFWQDPTDETKLKKDYKKYMPTLVFVSPNGKSGGSDALKYWFIKGSYRFCTNCGDEASPYGRDINRLSGLTGEGRSSATTMITLSILRELYKNPPKPSEKETRKILGFIDNRQDAALQSGHFNDFIFLITLRTAVLEAVKKQGGTATLNDFPHLIVKALNFDDGTPESELEYLKQTMQSPLLKKRVMNTLYDILGFRVMRDVRRGWRYNNPNLENLNMLQITFTDLDGFSKYEQDFEDSADLAALHPSDREKIARFILNDMTQNMCINSRYLQNEVQQQIMAASHNSLREPWNFEKDDMFTARKLQIGGKRNPSDSTIMSGDPRSRLSKLLRKWMANKTNGIPDLYKKIESRNSTKSHDWTALITDFCEAAWKYGLLCKTKGKDCVYYQINEDALVWSIPPETNNEVNQYFHNLYNGLVDDLENDKMDIFRFQCSEHTAQIDSNERKLLEKRFRYEDRDINELKDTNGNIPKRIPVLYCSPTMELGIDIASLNVVYLRNVPPTPANYAQRSGRAGRSGQPALVINYCSAQSPHDQWFFHHKEQMVYGQVTPPCIDLLNEELVTSHLHSIWLGSIKYDMPSKICDILDMDNESMPLLNDISHAINDPNYTDAALKLAEAHMAAIDFKGTRPDWLTPNFASQIISASPQKFNEAFNRWRALYASTLEQIKRANAITETIGGDPDKKKEAQRRSAEALRQQRVLRGAGSELNSDFNTYRYLGNQGFLPGYNFPRLPLMAWIPGAQDENTDGKMITRQRFLAISEFGPRSLIYHKGKTYRVVRAKIEKATGQVSAGADLATESIKICENCGCGNKISADADATTSNVCASCGAALSDAGRVDKLYRIEAVETMPVERININDEERQRQGFEIQTAFQFLPGTNGIQKEIEKIISSDGSDLLELTYSPSARIWKINKGWRRRAHKEVIGFEINPLTGYWCKRDTGDDSQDVKNQEDEAAEKLPKQRIVPYVEDRRNVMIFKPKTQMTNEDMATLQSALCRSMEAVFEVEESEIAVEALPSRDDRKTLLFYEASEGGAGVLSRIVREPALLREIAKKSLEIMHYNFKDGDSAEKIMQKNAKEIEEGHLHCETGCYRCLLSYYNQPDHDLIDRRRKPVLEFLIALADSHASQSTGSAAPSGRLAEWLASLDKFGLRHPDAININSGGIKADALYRDYCTAIVLGSADESTKDAAERMGYIIVEFPDNKDEWAHIFDDHKDMFGKRC